MRINRLALLAGAALTVAGGLLTTVVYADGRGLIGQADTNHDGVVDQSEFQASRDKWFAELDTNHDGFITADELKAFGDKMHANWLQKHANANPNATQQGAANTANPAADQSRSDRMAQHILARVDTDHDGKISKAEFDTETAALFKRLDANGDGKIASDELPSRRWGQMGMRMFDRMDANGDGKVTKAEFTAAGDQMFQKLDLNGDGVITKDEMQAASHHGKGKGPDGLPPAPNGAPVLPNGAPDQAPTP